MTPSYLQMIDRYTVTTPIFVDRIVYKLATLLHYTVLVGRGVSLNIFLVRERRDLIMESKGFLGWGHKRIIGMAKNGFPNQIQYMCKHSVAHSWYRSSWDVGSRHFGRSLKSAQFGLHTSTCCRHQPWSRKCGKLPPLHIWFRRILSI